MKSVFLSLIVAFLISGCASNQSAIDDIIACADEVALLEHMKDNRDDYPREERVLQGLRIVSVCGVEHTPEPANL